MSLNKVLGYKGGDVVKPRILLLAPTGLLAVNIIGTTTHSGLGINVGSKLYSLNDQKRTELRNKLSEVRFQKSIIIRLNFCGLECTFLASQSAIK